MRSRDRLERRVTPISPSGANRTGPIITQSGHCWQRAGHPCRFIGGQTEEPEHASAWSADRRPNHANRVTTSHRTGAHACTRVHSNPWLEEDYMPIGLSLFAIMVGAILKFAVTAQLAGISLSTVGLILMVVGAVGLLVSLWLILAGRAAAEF